METDPKEITFFAKTNFRNREVPFGIKGDDRRRHMYVIGKTGMGKTTLMENMAIQDIRNGHGVCFIDPHGDSVVKILDYVPSSRVNDVIYFNPADLSNPIAFNIMESVENKFKHLVASGLMSVFTKIWANLWSARMEYILGNTIRALLDSPNNTMLGISRMYIDKQYRKRIVDNIKDPMVKMFWTDEFANYDPKWLKEAISPIQNKVGQFLSSAIIRNIVGQPKSTIDLRQIMDERKILLMDLSKGKVGEENAALLGAMIITKIQLAAMSRVDMQEADRPDFYLYVDEFQNFATESFATILSEARKYHLSLIMGHQYIGQLTPDKSNTRLRDAIFGNVGTIVCFRVGAADAEYLETEFAPTYTPNDLVNLPKYHILLKLMINGVASEPFSAQSIPVNPEFITGNSEKVIRVSRERYGNPIDQVEEKISRWMGVEYHQQNALVVGGEEADDGTPTNHQFIDAPSQSVKVLPLQSGVIQQAVKPVGGGSPARTAPPISKEEPTQQRPAEVANSPEGLIFRMPEPPKAAPPQPYVKNPNQPTSQISKPQPEKKVFPAAPQRPQQAPRPRQPEAPKPARPKDKPRDNRQPGKPQRPNIWETVADIHEERTSQVVENLGAAIQGAHGPIQSKNQAE